MTMMESLMQHVSKALTSVQEALGHVGVDEAWLFSASPESLLALVEAQGQEPVLRSLAISYASSTDPLIRHKTEFLIEVMERSLDLQGTIREECPVCGNVANRLCRCHTCGFSFLEDFRCPYLQENRRCGKNGSNCGEIGLEYETCPVYTEHP